MKINIFKSGSSLFPFRWFIVIAALLTGWLVYANLTGWRLMSFPEPQETGATGPGYHK